MSRPVAVTGAAGLIGSAVTARLLDRGHPVVALDDFSIGAWERKDERLTWARLDVASGDLGQALDGRDVAAVVHCAAHPGGRSLEQPSDDVRVNAFGSMRVFEWCARSRVPVVYLSSSAVYGEQPPGPIPEIAELRPGTVYAACKIACERFLDILGRGYGLPWTVLRLFATYGAGHKPSLHQGILNVMLTQLMSGDRVAVKGPLERTRDLVYVDDAAEAVVSAVENPLARGRVINVGTGVPATVRELIDHLARALARDPSGVRIEVQPGTVGDPRHSVADPSMARRVLGWRPRWSLAQGAAELVKARTAAGQGLASRPS